ncbi:MAG TPA: MFS transporter, partial [Deinococcales bacterium]|nr:MFS transporter [Deinococcales bacterium]
MKPLSSPAAARLATLAVFFVNGAVFASWAANIPSVRARLGLTPAALGFVILSIAAGSVVALVVTGRLIDRFGSRGVMISSSVAFSLLLPLALLAPSVPVIVPLLFLFGASASAMDVAMNAHGVHVERRLGRPIMSSLHALFSCGSLAGAGVAAVALSAGFSAQEYGIACAVLMLAITAWAWPRALPGSEDRGQAEGGPIFVLPTGALLGMAILVLCSYVGEGAVADWSAVYMRDGLGVAAGTAPLAYTAFALAMTASRFMGDALRARFDSVTLLRLSGGLAAAGMGAALVLNNPVAAIVGFACAGFGFANVVPVLFSAAGRVPGIPAGMAIAAVASTGYLGFLAGPPTIGLLAQAFTLKAALAVVIFLATAIFLLAGLVRAATREPARPVEEAA